MKKFAASLLLAGTLLLTPGLFTTPAKADPSVGIGVSWGQPGWTTWGNWNNHRDREWREREWREHQREQHERWERERAERRWGEHRGLNRDRGDREHRDDRWNDHRRDGWR